VKIAYLIQCHKEPAQVERLVRVLHRLDPVAIIHVSHDVNGEPGIDALRGLDRTTVVQDIGGRGQFHFILRWLKAIEQIREQGGADFVVMLSGQDYPLRPLVEMHTELAASGDGFLEHFPALVEEGNQWSAREGRSRYTYRWREICTISDRTRDRIHLLHGLNRLQPLVRVNVAYGGLKVGFRGSHIPAGMECRGGSMFHSLSWRSVEYVVRTVRDRPDLLRWARSSLNIDEAFFQTVLVSAGQFHFLPSARRFYRFEGSHFGHPKVLTAADARAALDSGDYFARKFDRAVHPEAFDVVDRALGL